jgi:hypothetical protein
MVSSEETFYRKWNYVPGIGYILLMIVGALKLMMTHTTVCIEIKNAKSGDILKVVILDINVEVEDLDCTDIVREYHPLAYYIYLENLGWSPKTVMINDKE